MKSMVWILIYRDIVHTNILDICIYHLLTKHIIDVCIIIQDNHTLTIEIIFMKK